eukprot:gene12526-biopygen22983
MMGGSRGLMGGGESGCFHSDRAMAGEAMGKFIPRKLANVVLAGVSGGCQPLSANSVVIRVNSGLRGGVEGKVVTMPSYLHRNPRPGPERHGGTPAPSAAAAAHCCDARCAQRRSGSGSSSSCPVSPAFRRPPWAL